MIIYFIWALTDAAGNSIYLVGIGSREKGSMQPIGTRKELSMKFSLKRISVVLSFALCAGSFVTAVKAADDWQWSTVLNVREPVQVDRLVLSPGTYLFQLFPSPVSRNVVMIYSVDKKRWDGFASGIPIYRSGALENSSLVVKGNSGEHPALQSWFYQGRNRGIQFVANR